jgi:hypothetical protein
MPAEFVPQTPYLPWGQNTTFTAAGGSQTFPDQPAENQRFDSAGGFQKFPERDPP